MIYHVLALDDEEKDRNILVEAIKEYGKKAEVSFDITTFDKPLAFLESYSGSADIIFLDIKMDLVSGMEVAKEIRKKDEHSVIVFITTCVQYAVQGYEVNAFDFIVKPIIQSSFDVKMERILKYVNSHSDRYYLNINKKNSVRRLDVSEIEYIEVMDHNIIYHLKDEDIEERRTLSSVADELLPHGFSFCNACYLVNLKYVQSIVDNEAFVGKTRLAISKAKKKNFVMDLAAYLGGTH